MRKLFSISGNKYFWLIMTGGKGLKIHLGWIVLITFFISVAEEKKKKQSSPLVLQKMAIELIPAVGMLTKLHSGKEVG